jgi:hypothetical protein
MSDTPFQRDTNRRDAANNSLQEWYGHLPENCEMHTLASLVFRRTVDFFRTAEYSSFDHHSFSDVLSDTKNFLSELRGTLNPINPSLLYPNGGTAVYEKSFYESRLGFPHRKDENPETWLNFFTFNNEISLLALLQEGKESSLFWPIGDLAFLCAEYLRKPWIQCGRIDRLLIRAMLYTQVIDLHERVTLASLNRYTDAYKKRERKAMLWSVLWWLVAALIGVGAAITHGWWAAPVVAPAFVLLIDLMHRQIGREVSTTQLGLLSTLDAIHRVFLLTGKNELSIVLLRERLTSVKIAESEPLRDEIFSIIDCAVARGVVLWGVEKQS